MLNVKCKKLIIANWKMNPLTVKEVVSLAKKIDDKDLVICPPLPFLSIVKNEIEKSELGAQNIFWENKGAYTGEVSARMIKEFGVKYVIIGHSERRKYLGETDEMIAKKIRAAIENKLIPILCVGETIEQRKGGGAEKVIKSQLQRDLSLVIGHRSLVKQFIVAYEPIWAIGTGISCEPKEAARIHRLIRGIISNFVRQLADRISNLRIIYGGSVDSKNIGNYLKYNEIEGALVGGASLRADEIKKIVKISKSHSVSSNLTR